MNWFNKNRNKILAASIFVIAVLGIFFSTTKIHAVTDTRLPIFNGTALPKAAAGAASTASTFKDIGLGFLGKAGDVATWGLAIYGILNVIYAVLLWFISFGYSLLNMAVNTALDPHWFQIDAVIKGWTLVRDFSNIWFILVILFISITTILRIESYGVKKLLPNVILMAFLINFSLPITTFVIDMANVIAVQFKNAVCHEHYDPNTKTTTCDVSGNIENALNSKAFTEAFIESTKEQPQNAGTPANNAAPANTPNLLPLVPQAHAQVQVLAALPAILEIAGQILGALGLASLGWGAIQTYLGNSSFLGVATKSFIGITVSDIFLAFTAYIILAIAVLFLIRIITLLFIVIVSPLGFLASVVPGVKKFGDEWWDKLFAQSFFAPVSLFFLWVSLTLMQNMKDAMTINGVSYDFTDPTNARLIFYIFSIILLYGSLWAAKKMGAFGADTLLKWLGTAQGAITGFVGGVAARNLVAPIGAGLLGAGVPQRIARLPGGTIVAPQAQSFARWLSTRGGAETDAAAKAALGMTLALAERPAYFGKLDRAGKEAMLRKMKDDERAAFMQTLAPQQQQIAQQILRSGKFTPEEQAKFDLDAWKRLTKEGQIQQFAGLNNDSKEAVLRSLSDSDRAALVASLPAAEQAIAQGILRSARFTPSEQAKFDLEAWKRLPRERLNDEFAKLNAEAKEQVLKSMSDDDKARFIGGLENPKADLAQETKDLYARAARESRDLLNSAKLTTKERSDFDKADRKFKITGSEREAAGLVGFMDRALSAENGEKEALANFKVMDDRQRLVLLETWSKDTAKLDRWNKWFQNEVSPEDQDKFHRDTLRRASNEALNAYVDSSEVKINPDGTSVTDRAIQERVLAALPAQQQAKIFELWNKNRNNPKNAERLRVLDKIAETKLSADAQQSYYKEVARVIGDKPNDEIAEFYKDLPKKVGIEIMRSRKIDLNIALIDKLDPVSDKAVLDRVFKHVREAGQSGEFAKKLNPVYKVQYLDIDPEKVTLTPAEIERRVVQEIRVVAPKDLSQRITVKALDNKQVRNALLSGGSLSQIAALMDTPAKSEKMKQIFTEIKATVPSESEIKNSELFKTLMTSLKQISDLKERENTAFNQIMANSEAKSEAMQEMLTRRFEREYNNKVLGEQLAELWKSDGKTLTPPQKSLKKQIFG